MPMPNWEMVTTPYANCPIAMIPLATTGILFGRYLNEICSSGSPQKTSFDLYSNPQPPQFSFAGYGAPQCGQVMASSEISCLHSLHGFIVSTNLGHDVSGATLSCPVFNYALPLFSSAKDFPRGYKRLPREMV